MGRDQHIHSQAQQAIDQIERWERSRRRAPVWRSAGLALAVIFGLVVYGLATYGALRLVAGCP